MITPPAAIPYRQVRATSTDRTITVYQAYPDVIAGPALAAGTFVPPFRRGRMTWIKPSFLWMAYRSGRATKAGQERVLAVEVTREGFLQALDQSCLSHYEPGSHPSRDAWADCLQRSPVRVQWDPERDLQLRPLDHRTIQAGLSGGAVDAYLDDWIIAITDATPTMHRIGQLVGGGRLHEARALLPLERPYPLPPRIMAIVAAT